MGLVLDQVSFAYGSQAVLAGLSAARIDRGSLAALVGPNGSGKSTLFRALAGTARGAHGAARLDGHDLLELDARRRAARVFHLTQEMSTGTSLSVFELVLLARKCLGGSPWLAAGRSALDAVASTLAELGIEDLRDRPASTLSGGQRQLAGLAQALVREPDVLLLDEPTSALDVRRQLEVMATVQRVARSRGIVVIAALHDLSLAARFADRLLLLKDGAIAADGVPDAVLATAAMAEAYGVGIHLENSRRGTLLVESYLQPLRAAE